MNDEQVNAEKIEQLSLLLVTLTEACNTSFQSLITHVTPLFEYLQQAGESLIILEKRVQKLETHIKDRQLLENRIDVLESLVEVLMCGKGNTL